MNEVISAETPVMVNATIFVYDTFHPSKESDKGLFSNPIDSCNRSIELFVLKNHFGDTDCEKFTVIVHLSDSPNHIKHMNKHNRAP